MGCDKLDKQKLFDHHKKKNLKLAVSCSLKCTKIEQLNPPRTSAQSLTAAPKCITCKFYSTQEFSHIAVTSRNEN